MTSEEDDEVEDEDEEQEEEEEDEEESGEDEEEEEEEEKDDQEPQTVVFSVGELVWGAARGHPSLPGKVVPAPGGSNGETSMGKRSVWVRWFGGRPVIELVPMESLKSLSEGLDAHHRAQKDTRK